MISGERGFIGSHMRQYDLPDVLFHCAWHGSRTRNEDQTPNILMSLKYIVKAHDAGIERFVLLGSQAEDGFGPYSEAKRALKRIMHDTGLNFVWAKLFSVYGPGDHPDTLISKVIYKLLHNEPIRLTKCETIWDYLYVDDVCKGLQSVALSGIRGTISIGSGEGVHIKDVVLMLRDMINPKAKIIFAGDDLIDYKVANTAHINTIWKPEVTLAEGLKRTVEWQESLY